MVRALQLLIHNPIIVVPVFAAVVYSFLLSSRLRYVALECVGGTSTSASKSTSGSQRSLQQHNYQTPAAALYEATEDPRVQTTSAGRSGKIVYKRIYYYMLSLGNVNIDFHFISSRHSELVPC